MTDDDRLDAVLAERFRALDDVVPPDTWPAVAAVRATGPRRWPLLAAAAAVVLIVGAIAVLARDGADEAIVDAPGTTPVVATASPPSASTVSVVEDALAVADPAVVRPGGQLTITPAGVVQQYCDKVNVIGPVTGTIMGGQWTVVDPLTATYSCDGPLSDAPVAVTVPPLTTGDYRFCIAVGDVPEGCARVTVVVASEELPGDADAEPASAEPGDRIVLTPTGPVQRQCTDLVSVYDAATRYVGHIGARFSPSPGEGDTVPACIGDVSAEPIEVFVPPLPAGMYSFCVSDQLTPEGCAKVEVLPSPLLATASSSEVITGDTIVITPAGVVPRICSDIVVVRDLARVGPLVQTHPDGTSEPPRPGGGWDRPECLPEPSAAPLMLVVPDIDTGAYAFCLSDDVDGAGCALVTVVGRRVPDPSVPPDMTLPAPETTAPPNDEAMAAYRNQQALFRAGDFPLDPASESSCDECSAGAVVGVQRYAVVDRVDQPDGLIGPVATVLYGDVYAVDGVEPAVALVLDGSPEGNPRDWYLMVLENGPRVFADPADETELQAAWCGVSARFPELADFLGCSPA